MGVSIMHMPVYTAITAAVLMILQMVLMSRAISQRAKSEVLIGDGGVDAMQQAIRVHGNLVENAPIFLIGLGLVEVMGGNSMAVGIIGAVFVVSRLAHAIGFSMNTGVTKGRFLGTIGSMTMTVGTAGYLVYLALGAL